MESNMIIKDAFNKLRANQFVVSNAGYKARIKKLNTLKTAVEKTFRPQILEALKKDLNKPKVEALLTEIYPIVSDVKFAKSNLHLWMRPQPKPTPLALFGSKSYTIYEPKGVCLIISPWNFPFNLTFGPLISAIAAGNTIIIKPSELAPHCSAVMKTIVEAVFSKEEVMLFEGGVETSQQLLSLPFNHIFFTGSPSVGKIVMKAAAEHLASVTLELGGKSPTVVHKSANLKTAAKKIMWGKFMNCGQTCIAPDYILIDANVKTKFLEYCDFWLKKFELQSPKSDAYGKIINQKHFKRLKGYLEEAKTNDAKVETGSNTDEKNQIINPTLLSEISLDSKLMQDEIFGPILPIVTYQSIEECIKVINQKEKPLALYIYAKDNKVIKQIIKNTRAGGTCINNNIIHYSNHHLPFGGSNHSGIGKSHGFYGFKAFSNERAFIKQFSFGATELVFPPYTKLKEKMTEIVLKWF